MGTPLPPIVPVPAVLCENCWGPAGPFGPVTPDTAILKLEGWSEGDDFLEIYRPELDSSQLLLQQPAFPCTWSLTTANFVWIVDFGTSVTRFSVRLAPPVGTLAFFREEPTPCQQIIPNGLTDPANVVAFGGIGSVYFGGAP